MRSTIYVLTDYLKIASIRTYSDIIRRYAFQWPEDGRNGVLGTVIRAHYGEFVESSLDKYITAFYQSPISNDIRYLWHHRHIFEKLRDNIVGHIKWAIRYRKYNLTLFMLNMLELIIIKQESAKDVCNWGVHIPINPIALNTRFKKLLTKLIFLMLRVTTLYCWSSDHQWGSKNKIENLDNLKTETSAIGINEKYIDKLCDICCFDKDMVYNVIELIKADKRFDWRVKRSIDF